VSQIEECRVMLSRGAHGFGCISTVRELFESTAGLAGRYFRRQGEYFQPGQDRWAVRSRRRKGETRAGTRRRHACVL